MFLDGLDLLEFEVGLVEPEHRARAMSVDLVHANLCLFPVLETDVCHQLPGLVFLDCLHGDDVAVPVFLSRHPGSDVIFHTVGVIVVQPPPFRGWRVIGRGWGS